MSTTPASLPMDAYDLGPSKPGAADTSNNETTFLAGTPTATLIPLFLDPQYSSKASSSTSSPQTLLASLVAIPFQAISIFILSKVLHQLVLCVNEVYEITGRRARSKFVGISWFRISAAVLLMGFYHVGLLRLMGTSYRRLRSRGVDVGKG